MEETIEKEEEKVEKVPIKAKNKRIKLRLRLYFWLQNKLKKYDFLERPEGDLTEWTVDNIKKPLVYWILKILKSSLPIFLVLVCIMRFEWFFIQMSIGIAITWFLVIEFVKDMKRVK